MSVALSSVRRTSPIPARTASPARWPYVLLTSRQKSRGGRRRDRGPPHGAPRPPPGGRGPLVARRALELGRERLAYMTRVRETRLHIDVRVVTELAHLQRRPDQD